MLRKKRPILNDILSALSFFKLSDLLCQLICKFIDDDVNGVGDDGNGDDDDGDDENQTNNDYKWWFRLQRNYLQKSHKMCLVYMDWKLIKYLSQAIQTKMKYNSRNGFNLLPFPTVNWTLFYAIDAAAFTTATAIDAIRIF